MAVAPGTYDVKPTLLDPAGTSYRLTVNVR